MSNSSISTQAPFIHLRLHSAYSLLEGAIKIKDLVKQLKKEEVPAIALTDTGNLFGVMEFSLECMAAGVQPIIGCQVRLQYRQEHQKAQTLVSHSLPKEEKVFYDELVLLVQNEKGYENLSRLVSQSYLAKDPQDPPHITLDDLQKEETTAGLLALTGGIKGTLGRLLLQGQEDEAKAFLETLKTLFPGNLYIEIQRHGLSEEEVIEDKLIQLAYEYEVPLVATNEPFFLEKRMHKAHDALLCIAEGKYIAEQNRRQVTPEHYLKSSQEMAQLFADLPEAYLNTAQVAKRCAFGLDICKPILPPFPTLSGKSEEEELRIQAKAGLEQRLKEGALSYQNEETDALRKTYEERLTYELDVIIQMGYAGYFLIVADFIQWAKSQNIPVGPGRGSGAGSLVAWSLTITDVDPIRFHLIFERFLNPERVSLPDFDVDFCQDRRDEVIQYVIEKYGWDRVAQIITFGKLQAKAVVRDVGRVLGMPYTYVDKISKLIPFSPTNPVTLEEAIEQEPELRALKESDPQVAELMDIALDLEGLYRHASTHAAGIVIGDRPLEKLVPLYRDPKSNIPVTQFNMKAVEQAGLVKFDFLGLKTLTVIEDAAKLIRKKGIPFDISKIPLDDPKTFELLRRVETHALFQVEGAGMSDALRHMQPDRFEDLVALVALYRPGPMDDIPRYNACKNGKEPVTYPHPMLEPILKETFGVMVYQEQVMQIAQVLAGYTMGGADLLRRAMGKKIKAEMDAQRDRFIDGAVKNGVGHALAQHIFDLVAKFASYGFNKSHSAPYALISYQTAYLKANYPVEFFTAVLTHDRTNTDKLHETCQEIGRVGIEVLPPDINKSEVLFSIEVQENGHQAIRYALSAIKSVGEGSMEEVVAERERNGPYKDIFDFVTRHSTKVVNKRLLEKLIGAGAFDSLNPDRGALYENIDFLLKASQETKKNMEVKATTLFGEIVTSPSSSDKKWELPPCAGWAHLEKLQKEFEAIGFYLSDHPLKDAQSSFETCGVTLISHLQDAVTQQEGTLLKIAGVVISIQKKIAKSGNPFAFLTLSDPSGIAEVTVFSEVLQKSRDLLEEGRLVLLRLNGRKEGETLRLTAQSVEPFESLWGQEPVEKTLVLEEEKDIPLLIKALEPFQGKGKSVLRLKIPISLSETLRKEPFAPLYAQILVSDSLAFPPHFDFKSK